MGEQGSPADTTVLKSYERKWKRVGERCGKDMVFLKGIILACTTADEYTISAL